MHLSSFPTASEVALMRTHIAAVAAQMVPIMQQCVRTLSATCPEAEHAFPLGTKREQFDAACICAHIAKSIADLESIRDWLKATGSQLGALGFTDNDCTAAKAALLNALRDHSGSLWTMDHECAFKLAFEQVFEMLASGMPAPGVRTALRLAA